MGGPVNDIAIKPQSLAAQICTELLEYAATMPTNAAIGPTTFTRMELRERILAFEVEAFAAAAAGELETCDMATTFPVRHIFAPGAVAREMSLPALHWAIGKIHRHPHLSFITKGRIAVLTEEGPTVFEAPYTFVSTPGCKRVVLALSDTIWTTVHITNETDLDKIEEAVIAKNYDEFNVFELTAEPKEKLP